MAANELLIASRLQTVIQRIDAAFLAASTNRGRQSPTPHPPPPPPRLVAVSKTKPIADIVEAYRAGQRYFGENYVQELFDKSHSEELRRECPDIRWHFIGHCQSNNAKRLAQVRNLETVETIDSVKLANQLHKEWVKLPQSTSGGENAPRLRVFLQVNTSSEEQKHGCPVEQAPSLAQHVVNSCPAFRLAGLMTIGSLEASTAVESNADFERLVECRQRVAEALGLDAIKEGEETQQHYLELSMGMSADYELAIRMGSTNVRIGSTIFGARSYNT